MTLFGGFLLQYLEFSYDTIWSFLITLFGGFLLQYLEFSYDTIWTMMFPFK